EMTIKRTVEGTWEAIASLLSSKEVLRVQPARSHYQDVKRVNTALLPLLGLGLGAAILLPQLAHSQSPGERLAAVVILSDEVRPYLDRLARKSPHRGTGVCWLPSG